MNKSDLPETLSRDMDLTLKMAEEVVNTVFNDMADTLINGDRVEIRGFGFSKSRNTKDIKAETLKQIKSSMFSQRSCHFLNAVRD